MDGAIDEDKEEKSAQRKKPLAGFPQSVARLEEIIPGKLDSIAASH
jgi:hypothetical protein